MTAGLPYEFAADHDGVVHSARQRRDGRDLLPEKDGEAAERQGALRHARHDHRKHPEGVLEDPKDGEDGKAVAGVRLPWVRTSLNVTMEVTTGMR
mgnify:CR=1 FL=1